MAVPEPVELRWGERTILDVDGVAIHVERAGDDGPTVAALHGFSSGTFTWAGVAPHWADRARVVAWDRPPFGRSDRPAPPRRGAADPYGLDAVLAQARAVLAAHAGDAPVVLVGHSAGAVVAQHLVQAGLAVAGVVLIAPALDGAPPALVRRAFDLPGADRVGATALRLAMRGAGVALRRAGQHGTPLLDATSAETARLLRRPGTAEALVHLTRTWRPLPPFTELRPLGVPTLVVGGDEDRIVRPATATAVARALDAELHVLPGVGHAAHEQVPDVVAPLVGAFVEDVAR